MKTSYQLIQLEKQDPLPFDLLLLADETKEAIEKYIYTSEVYVLRENSAEQAIAVFVLQALSTETLELKNIAVAKYLQGKGWGSLLMRHVEMIAAKKGYQEIIVGTPDTALSQINFYEKNGYVKYGLRENFFLDNYPHPIIENGIVLKNMQMLRKIIAHGKTAEA